jgi:hypothetical protein
LQNAHNRLTYNGLGVMALINNQPRHITPRPYDDISMYEMAQKRSFVQQKAVFLFYFSLFLRQHLRHFFNNSENALTPDLTYCKTMRFASD